MLELACQDKEVCRFMTVPGIGPVTALTYKAEIFDATRFKESRSVGAYLGMTPTQYASGERQTQGKTSNCESKELRFLLVEAEVAVGRKLAVIMHRMMLEEKDFIYGEPKAV